MIAGHEPRHAHERTAGHQLRSDYVVFTERMIFRQDGDEVHPVARDGEPGRIDRRLGDTDVVAPRGKHSAHHVGVANEEFDFDVGALFGKGGNDGGQQRYTRHRMARNCQRSNLASVCSTSSRKTMASAVGRTRLPERTKRAKPTSDSSRAICALTAGWVRPRDAAAWVMEPLSRTLRNASRRRGSICINIGYCQFSFYCSSLSEYDKFSKA